MGPLAFGRQGRFSEKLKSFQFHFFFHKQKRRWRIQQMRCFLQEDQRVLHQEDHNIY